LEFVLTFFEAHKKTQALASVIFTTDGKLTDEALAACQISGIRPQELIYK
jgi:hypothetical protein